jgi:hypothetical protein
LKGAAKYKHDCQIIEHNIARGTAKRAAVLVVAGMDTQRINTK